MTTAQHTLTPVTDRTPAVVEIQSKRLSGASWCRDFPGSSTFDKNMAEPFSANAQTFISALKATGATISIASIYRPPNRAFLMHWSWKIVNDSTDPRTVPEREGVDIKWDHTDENGNYSSEKSIQAAQAMVNTYGIQNLKVAPSLTSRHTEGNAMDISVSWSGTLTINQKDGTAVLITTEPRTGMNTKLHEVGATYGVVKFIGGSRDKPHWSNDGH